MLRSICVKTRESYLITARHVFLKGLPYNKIPAEAVAAGTHSSLEWCEVLARERARQDPNASEDEHPEAPKA